MNNIKYYRANETALVAEPPFPELKRALETHPISRNMEIVESISSQKKNPRT